MLPRRVVYWVNTIGTRTPHFDRATISRGSEKLRQWLRRPTERAEAIANLRVFNPTMWPWFGAPFHRRLNRRLLLRQLSSTIEDLPAPPVAVTTIPIVADLMDDLRVARWVYYCVDDFSQWPGLDQSTLRRMEARVIDRADVLIASSEHLHDRFAGMGRRAHLLTHGVDLDLWRRRRDDAAASPAELRGIERPLVLFWGTIDRRMDVNFLSHLAANMSAGTIVLVGPEMDPHPATFAHPRVKRTGSVPLERLPHLAHEAAVLIMPYADLPVTRAMQPLKLTEYLATGKPAVARSLPATRPWADCMDVVDTPAHFARVVRERLECGLPEVQRTARRRLGAESWDDKARHFEKWILQPEPATSGEPLAIA
jgi:glycosyltransferase involved in cell wall biosynthesis